MKIVAHKYLVFASFKVNNSSSVLTEYVSLLLVLTGAAVEEVRTISLYSLTIPLRFMMFSVIANSVEVVKEDVTSGLVVVEVVVVNGLTVVVVAGVVLLKS